MVDTLDKQARSRHMGLIRQAGTSPELAVRRIAHRIGYRFRVSRRDLPGCPDIVFPGRRAAIFVHGCFWHRHEGCPRSTTPKTNADFWTKKFAANQARDRASLQALAKLGWRTLVIWECETRDEGAIAEKLKAFLEPDSRPLPGPRLYGQNLDFSDN
jgi:DNA mismatch endonuclease (patch repair protein)